MPREWMNLDPSSPIVFVIASGSTLSHYPKEFLLNLKSQGTVIGVNDVALDVPCHYNLRKSFSIEGQLPDEVPDYDYANPECILVISEFDCGSMKGGLRNANLEGDYFYFRHNQNYSQLKFELPDPAGEEILVSWTTTNSAMHLAAKLGAKIIILIGHDMFSGNYSGYSTERTPFFKRGPRFRGPSYWKFRGQAIVTQSFLQSNYDTTVSTLSPFMGVGFRNNNWPRYKDTVVKVLEIIRTLPRIALGRIKGVLWGRKR